MANVFTSNTNAAANNVVKEMFTMSNARIIAATPFAAVAAGAAFVAEASALVGKKVAGEKNWDNVPFSGYVNKHTAGFVFNVPSAEEALKMAEAKRAEKSPLSKHSDKVEWDKWHWVCSAAYVEAQKKAGKEAILPSLYKAANNIINFAKYGKGDLTTQYKGVSYARRIEKAIYGHATWLLEEKGVKNAFEPALMKAYFDRACWLSMVAADKLPTWEDIQAVTGKEDAAEDLAAEIAADERPETREGRAPKTEPKKEEAREGRAPKTEQEETVRKYNDLLKVIGVKAVRAANAKEAAQKAGLAHTNGLINDSELRAVIEKAASKFPEGSQEAAEILALC